MRRNELRRYYFELRTLSPLHIGTGEAYEPSNFVIDGSKLYEFDEALFLQSLSPAERKEFERKLENYLQIIDFYKNHRERAKQIAYAIISVTQKIAIKYDTVRNRDGSRNKNMLEIQRTYKNPNTHRAVIPGSSIKGMLDTVLGIYTPKVEEDTPRQELIVSDAALIEGETQIGYALRKHKHPGKESRSPIPQMVEIVQKGSRFVMSISTTKSPDEIIASMRRYHEERQDSRFTASKDRFVARIGKFSGKPYMVDDGKRVTNSYGKPVATHTLYETGDQPFGWVEFSLIDASQYEAYMEEIRKAEDAYYASLIARQKEIVATIEKQKAALKAEADERKRRLEELRKEEEAKQKAEEERKRKLESLSPVDRLVEEYDPATLVNMMKSGEIENYDEIKMQLAQKLKEKLQEDPKTWEKAKQKALKRKEFIESILE